MRAQSRLDRAKTLLRRLGDPQRRFPVIHVTGTSGKGSTSAAIAAILTAAGYRVGLRTSPYLQVPTEKLQIGHALIDPASFAGLTARIFGESYDALDAAELPCPMGYAEFWTAASMLWFAERQVDIAVVEVGAGGRFDATNVFDPLVSVITSVGLDHVVSLGPTVADIAWHKAGIIKRGSVAVVGDVPDEALDVIDAEAKSVGAPLRRALSAAGESALQAGMHGRFQQTNALVAATVVEELTRFGFRVPDAAVNAGIAVARMPGRLERMPGRTRPAVWLDGAHNADKIAALAAEALHLSPDQRRPVVVLGMLDAKDARAVAAQIAAFAAGIVVSEPHVVGKRARHALELAGVIEATGFHGPIRIEPHVPAAVALAEELASGLDSPVLVTGSMYLVGQARARWYPDRQVVLQRTPWPAQADASSGRLRTVRRLEREEADGQGDQPPDHQVLPEVDELAVGLQR